MFKLLKSGKSISVLSHTMQLLAVVSLFHWSGVLLSEYAHYESFCFSRQSLFYLFSSFPLLGGYINQLYLIEDQAIRLKLMIHIVKERCFSDLWPVWTNLITLSILFLSSSFILFPYLAWFYAKGPDDKFLKSGIFQVIADLVHSL